MASSRPAKRFDWKNLRLRVLSAAVLAPAVVGVVWVGGPLFFLMVAAAVAVLAVEWGRMSAPEKPLRTSLAVALAVLASVTVASSGHPWIAWIILPLVAIIAALVAQVRDLIERPVDAAFGVLRLFGTELDQRPGRVRLTAYWESTGKPDGRVRTVELVGPDGQVADRVEGVPLDPYLPPNRWDRGQIVVEAIDLRPPAGSAGTYRLRLGWRDQQGRTVASDGGETVEVGTVTLP
jgi:hypothetical protein